MLAERSALLDPAPSPNFCKNIEDAPEEHQILVLTLGNLIIIIVVIIWG